MQIFFISNKWTVVLFFFMWFIFQASAARISRAIPDQWFAKDNFLFKSRKWEKGGEIYSQVFRVKKWKKFLPDGAAISKKGYRKKNLESFAQENLETFMLESRRVELNHLLAITPFWVFALFAEMKVVGIMFLYALLVNMPCIIAQRFNRPRIARILERKNNLKK